MIGVILFLCLGFTMGQQFNMFGVRPLTSVITVQPLNSCALFSQDYSKAKVKPAQYSRNPKQRHDISEYMTPQQLQMAAQRRGPVTPKNAFDAKWSGFDKNQGSPVIGNRKLKQVDQKTFWSTVLERVLLPANVVFVFVMIGVTISLVAMRRLNQEAQELKDVEIDLEVCVEGK